MSRRLLGVTLVLPWCILGSSLVHPWCILCASLVHPWCILGASLVHPWCIPGASSVHPWCILAPLDLVPGPSLDAKFPRGFSFKFAKGPPMLPLAPHRPSRMLLKFFDDFGHKKCLGVLFKLPS